MMIPEQNIDPLFNDLKDLEVTPSGKVWDGIEEHLDKKKKRLVPLYWRLGAAASVLLVVGFFIFNSPDSVIENKAVSRHEQSPVSESSGTTRIAQKMETEGARQKTGSFSTSQETDAPVKDSAFSEERISKVSNKTENPDASVLAENDKKAGLLVDERQRRQTDRIYEKMMAHTYDADLLQVKNPDVSTLAYSNKVRSGFFEDKSEDSINDKKVPKSSLKFVLGGEYSPTYAFRETSGPVSGNSESGINKAGGGISLAVKVNSRWQIETGVKYAMLGQEVSATSRSDRVYSFASASPSKESSMDITEVNLSNSLGAVKPDVSPSRMQDAAGFQGSSNELVDLQSSDFAAYGNPLLEQNLGYLQVPLTIRYQLLRQSRLHLSLSGGVSTNWLVDNNAYLEMGGDKKRIGQTQGIADMGLSTHAGVAVSLPVFNGIRLKMEPRIDYFLSDISVETAGSFRPYSFGVFTGLFYEW